MPSVPRSLLSLAFIATILATASGRIEIRAGCSKDYKKCQPKGATSADPPALGTGLSPLYTDLVNSVQGVKKSKRDEIAALLQSRADSSNLCCADGTQCLLLQGLDLPFCYDNYTTNYFLPGGTTGQIVSGDYTSTEGTANLISGDFTKSDGTKGNVYGAEDSPSKPDTAALPIPTQYTASGSGSAIPATALGQVATITTTIPGTTVAPSTVAAQTLAPSVVDGTSTIGSSTVKAASTIPGTTVAAKTSVYTTTLAAPSPTGKKGAGAANTPNMSGAA
ncbi:hypothetical protein Q9189_005868, partial [Teloschistes chrysophthalmus]